MKNKRWIRVLGAAAVALLAGEMDAATIDERLAALEKKFEQETSAREEALLNRIRELEEQVKTLSEEEKVADKPAAPAASETDTELLTRIDSLEEQVVLLEEEQMSDPLKGVSIGGYGELHYNALSGSGGASDKREIDFHRFVLMFGKEFNDRIRFQSELEIEHAYSGNNKPGAVELEQAYVDIDLTENHTARAGLFLLPIGLLNETHEPPRFYGVERNPIEKNIIPTTWWEGGLGLHGQLTDTLDYAAYLHSGLATTAANQYAVRSGRKKVAKAPASDPAATVALNYRVPGVTVGGSVNVQADITQGAAGEAQASAWMAEMHMDVQRGPWGLRALYAQWNLDGAGPEAFGADRQFGWYVEPSYKINEKLGFFARYNQWDNQAGRGAANGGKEQIDVGINWWPHEQVVLKADYQWQNNENGKDRNGINLGVGYDF